MKKLLWFIVGFLFVAVAITAVVWMNPFWFKPPIKVGLLHSQTGVLAVNEQRLLNAELMAIDEINAKGGIHGRKLQPIIADGASDEFTFQKEALRLVTEQKVEVIVGCWSSATRKRVKEIVEKYDNLLLYPVIYEGIEESPNIIYFGATPNQSIIPALTWCFNNIGKKFFIIGADSLSSRVTHKIIELHLNALGAQVIDQEYVGPNGIVSSENIKKIAAIKPDVIINTLNGDTNISFFKELLGAGITSEQIPTISFRLSQADFARFDLKSIIGTYVLFSYAVESSYPFNKIFVANYKKRYGQGSVIDDAGQSAYSSVHMWAEAYKKAESSKPADIIPAFKNLVYQSPSGIIYLAENQHCWQDSILSKLAYNGDLIQIWKSERSIRPEVYPPYLTKKEWNEFLSGLYEGWGKRWSPV